MTTSTGDDQTASLTSQQRESVRRQAIVGCLQTLLLFVVLIQVIFAGILRALPPDLRAYVSFLHRIEWGVYLGILLIAVQIAAGWKAQVVLTNRFYALAWRLGDPRIVTGEAARYVQVAYLMLMLVLAGAVVWVRLRGFIVQP